MDEFNLHVIDLGRLDRKYYNTTPKTSQGYHQ